MRILLDTNILISAALFPNGVALTGDKDFLESGVENPKIINPSTFIEQW